LRSVLAQAELNELLSQRDNFGGHGANMPWMCRFGQDSGHLTAEAEALAHCVREMFD
jgi:hypothetical protein